MYFDTHLTRINKDIYRPSSNLIRFIKSVLAVIVNGQSPINSTASTRKRFH